MNNHRIVYEVGHALSNPDRVAILRTLAEHPGGLTIRQTLSLLGYPIDSIQSVRRHLRVLDRAGLVTSTVVNRALVYTLSPEGRERFSLALENLLKDR